MIKEFDIVIIGAGPAGAAAAIVAARAGLRVAICEASMFPRDRPGETLHPGIESIFQHLGVWTEISSEPFIRHKGVWHVRGEERFFHRYGADEGGAWSGFQIDRSKLDLILLTQAVRAGADLLQPFRARKVVTSANGRVCGILAAGQTLVARWIIDTAGGAHWLARTMNIPVQNLSPQLIARYGYAEGSELAYSNCPEFKFSNDGWLWTSKVKEGLYHWCRLSLGNTTISSMPHEYQHFKQIGITKAANVTWRITKRLAGPGFFMAGDAAAVLDPASSKGVIRAITTGCMVSKLILRIHEKRIKEVIACQMYENWLNNWIYSDAEKLRTLYMDNIDGIAERFQRFSERKNTVRPTA